MERKMVGKWFSFLSALIILLGIAMPQVKAEVMNREKYEMDWSYSKAKDREIKTEIIKTASGSIAYCLTPDLRSPNGEDLPEMGKTSDAVYRVLVNGYPQKSPSELGVATTEEAHYATQLAVWIASNELTEEDLVAKNEQVHNLMKRLVEASKKETESQDVFFKVNPIDPQTAMQKGDYLETAFYAIQTNAVSGSYTILPENAPKGIRIVNERGEEKSTLSINEKFKILIPKDTISGNFKMKVKSTLTNLQAIAFKGSEKIQNTTVLLQRNSEKISTDLIVNWESVGSLKIMKLGEQKEVLKGAVFEVSNENFKQNVTTNDKGIAELGNLPIGIYSVKEIQAPAGYVLDNAVKKIEVKTGETAVLELKNENIKGELEITKVDVADGNTKLPNAEFTIYNEQGKEVVKGKTNEQGVAKFKLPYGKYTYKETIAPNGYVVNEETFSFEIKENGEIIKHTVKNRKEEKPSTTPKPDQPQTPSVEVKPSIDDVKAIEKPAKDEVRLPMTGGTEEFALLFILGIGFIIAGAYVLRLKNRKEM